MADKTGGQAFPWEQKQGQNSIRTADSMCQCAKGRMAALDPPLLQCPQIKRREENWLKIHKYTPKCMKKYKIIYENI